MSLVRHLFRKTPVFTGFFLLAVLSFSGCQQNSPGVPSAFMTPKGIKAEAFLPQNSFIVFEFGAVDQQQQEAFKNLLKHFPSEDQQSFQKSLVEGFDKDLGAFGLSYEQDILPAIGDNFRVFAAFAGVPAQQANPEVYAFIPLADPAKMDAVFDKLVQTGTFTKTDDNFHTIISKNSGEQFMTRVDDMLIMTNGLDALKGALQRQPGGQSLLTDSVYQRALGQLKPSVAFAFIDLKNLINVISQDRTSRQEFEKVFTQMPAPSEAEAYQGEMFSVQAEEKGLRLYGAVFGDEEKMKTMDQNFLNLPSHPPYLYKKVPGPSVDAYFEGYNFSKILSYDLKIWNSIEGFAQGFEKVKQAFTQIGLDFDTDFMPLFEEGIAFTIHNNGSVLPSFGLYLDVEKHAPEADKVMSKLKTIVDIVLKDMEPTLKETPGLITNEETKVSGGKAYVIRVNINKMNSQNKNLEALQLLLTQPVEFWYGVSGDKLAFLAFEPKFDQNYQQAPKVSEDKRFQSTVAQLKGLNSGVGYLSPSTLVSYMDKVFDLTQLAAPDNQQSGSDYEKVKSYLKPITGLAVTSQPVSAGETHFEGFLLLE